MNEVVAAISLTNINLLKGFSFPLWPSSGWNGSPASFLIEAFVCLPHNILILIIGLFASSKLHYPH